MTLDELNALPEAEFLKLERSLMVLTEIVRAANRCDGTDGCGNQECDRCFCFDCGSWNERCGCDRF